MKKIIAFAVSLAFALCFMPIIPASAGSGTSGSGGRYTVIEPASDSGYISYEQGDIITFRGTISGGMRSNGASMCGLTETTNRISDMHSSIGMLYNYKLLYEGRINYSNSVITMTLDSTNIPPGIYRFIFVHTWLNYGMSIGNFNMAGMFQDIRIYAPGTSPNVAPSPTPRPVPDETPSSWALTPVTEAIALNLVPPNLRSRYTQAISRSDFCALAVALYEIVKDEVITGRVSFNDAPGNINVEKMAYVGVINGVGDGNVAPYSLLTREQAATMLARLAEAIGMSLPNQAAAFSDNSSISP